MPAHVFLDGSVYSPADPFATALVINEGQVEWVGQDAGARSILDDSMQLTELAGRLVAPSFGLAAAAVTEQDAPALCDQLAAAGYGVAHLLLPEPGRTYPQHPALEVRYYLPLAGLDLDQAPDGLGHLELEQVGGVYVTDPADLTEGVLTHLATLRLNLIAALQSPEAIGDYLNRLASLDPISRIRISPRLDGLTQLSDDHLAQAKDLQVTLGFSSDFDASAEAFSRALAAGASVALGSDPLGSPQTLGWELINRAVNPAQPDQAVSARAAFQATTRSIYRATGTPNPLTGQLVPGAAAHFALWQITELMVQTPDSRISAWSTDPRARTPLLPVLAQDVPRPQLVGLYRAGQAVG